jgi:glycosyltransferase involved in cell wall biosynthesis
MHIVFTIANNSSVPYFSWFARESVKHPEIKISFVALHSSKPAMLDEMQALGLDCRWIPFDASKRKASMMRTIVPLYKLFKKIRPDVVHAHLFDDAVPVMVAAKLARVGVRAITKQDTAFHWYYAPKAIKFDRMNNTLATHLVAVSNECKDFIIDKEKADPSKINVIHHGIDIEALTRQDEAYKQELISRFDLKGKKVIGTVARLIDWKGYKDIIKAAAIVVKKHPEARFLFAGEGPQKQELAEMIKKEKLEQHVMFTGFIPKEQIPSLYGIMDVYLHAARHEPFGFVIAEAMVNGAPVVSTPTGAARDAITHMENGYLAPYNNTAALAEGVLYMLTNDTTEMSRKARTAAAEMYSFRKMWEGHISMYRSALRLAEVKA